MLRPVTEAALAVLADEAPELPSYQDGYVPPIPPPIHVSVQAWQRTDTALRRISDDATNLGFRLLTTVVGATRREAEWAEEQVDAALRGTRLDVENYDCGPMRFEAEQGVVRRPDLDDFWTGTSAWTFTATPAAG